MTCSLDQKLLILQFKPHPNRMLCVGKRWGVMRLLVYDTVLVLSLFSFKLSM